MNEQERKDTIDRDEQLYKWWKASGMPKGRFTRRYRLDIDNYINVRWRWGKPAKLDDFMSERARTDLAKARE